MRNAKAVVFALLVGAALAVVPSATGRSSSTSGTLRIGLTGNLDSVDPAIAFGTTSWQLEYVTCAKLVNYRDAGVPGGSALQPEIAAAMPTVSADGLTYTFQIRNDYAFSPPASGVVTAASMKYSIERVLNGTLGSNAYRWLSDIVGATEYHNGQATEVTGIVAQGDTLAITLTQPSGDFLARLAMPFTCAVPIGFS